MFRCAGIRPQTLDAQSRLTTDKTDKTKVDEVLPVLMIKETKEEGDAKTEYYGKDRPCEE